VPRGAGLAAGLRRTGQQVCEDETVAFDDFANRNVNR
jgi:hypothetical protein